MNTLDTAMSKLDKQWGKINTVDKPLPFSIDISKPLHLAVIYLGYKEMKTQHTRRLQVAPAAWRPTSQPIIVSPQVQQQARSQRLSSPKRRWCLPRHGSRSNHWQAGPRAAATDFAAHTRDGKAAAGRCGGGVEDPVKLVEKVGLAIGEQAALEVSAAASSPLPSVAPTPKREPRLHSRNRSSGSSDSPPCPHVSPMCSSCAAGGGARQLISPTQSI
jgi:hypothetical protein